jgi:hypothetical protein
MKDCERFKKLKGGVCIYFNTGTCDISGKKCEAVPKARKLTPTEIRRKAERIGCEKRCSSIAHKRWVFDLEGVIKDLEAEISELDRSADADAKQLAQIKIEVVLELRAVLKRNRSPLFQKNGTVIVEFNKPKP